MWHTEEENSKFNLAASVLLKRVLMKPDGLSLRQDDWQANENIQLCIILQ